MRRTRVTEANANVVAIQDQASLSLARDLVRQVGSASRVPVDVIDRGLLVASELGTNHLRHGRAGYVVVRPVTRPFDDTTPPESSPPNPPGQGEHRGLEIIGMDRGRGIADVASAIDAPLTKSPSSASLGVGIGSIVRLSTEVDFDVRREEGTFIAARLFGRTSAGLSVVAQRAEIGIYGRPFEDQPPSGDHASFVRDEDRDVLMIAIADGLGHGRQAREASATAMRVFDRAGATPLEATLATMDEGLVSTRGAVVTLAELSATVRSLLRRTLHSCAVGNIEGQVTSFRQARRLRGTSSVLGQKRSSMTSATMKPQDDVLAVARNEVIVFATDGISSRCSIETDASLLGAHPIVIAQRIIENFGRDNDDALVVVVR